MGAEGPKAKERVSLGMINLRQVVSETWETAHVRRKLEHILFVFYGWLPTRPIGAFRTIATGFWRPDQESLNAIRTDWEAIRATVAEGRAADLSESLTRVLGAATKGPGHGSTSRAWSLKQPFVGWIYRDLIGASGPQARPTVSDPERDFEQSILRRLAIVSGKTTAEVAHLQGRLVGRSKSEDASIVRRWLDQPTRGRSGDFERFGIELKTIPVTADGVVLESMSFPAFTHEELVFESWPDSDLLGRLNRILVVPLVRERRATRGAAWVGRAFFWSPTEAQLDGMEEEWKRFRTLIEAGKSKSLPPASETRYLHIRPHGRDAADTELAPGGFDVTRKSFWLNASFVAEILRAHQRIAKPRRSV
jgi:DNA mismatch repair endonuclease MutH